MSNVVAGGGAFEPASAEIDPAAYAGEPSWNLNLLPHAAGSVLKSLPQSIQGITEPWLYMGMLFATFCWSAHNKQHPVREPARRLVFVVLLCAHLLSALFLLCSQAHRG